MWCSRTFPVDALRCRPWAACCWPQLPAAVPCTADTPMPPRMLPAPLTALLRPALPGPSPAVAAAPTPPMLDREAEEESPTAAALAPSVAPPLPPPLLPRPPSLLLLRRDRLTGRPMPASNLGCELDLRPAACCVAGPAAAPAAAAALPTTASGSEGSLLEGAPAAGGM
jgi:hypothetical protein